MSTVVVADDATDDAAEEVEEALEEVAEALDDVADAATDAVVLDQTIETAIDVAHLQDAITLLATGLDEVTGTVAGLAESVSYLNQRIEMAEQQAEEVAEDTGALVADVATEIEQASEEIKPDEVPSTRGHWFFRKWRG